MKNNINLHMIWLGSSYDKSKINEIKSIDSTCNLMLWLDDSVLHDSWRDIYNKFAANYQMMSDLLRLSVLRKFGGLYIDFDCSILFPIKTIVNEWTTLTVPTLGNSHLYMGDIIYCPIDWPHWNLVDKYLENFSGDNLCQLSFGHILFSSLPKSVINMIVDNKKFPSYPHEMSNECFIRRYPIK